MLAEVALSNFQSRDVTKRLENSRPDGSKPQGLCVEGRMRDDLRQPAEVVKSGDWCDLERPLGYEGELGRMDGKDHRRFRVWLELTVPGVGRGAGFKTGRGFGVVQALRENRMFQKW